MHSDLFRTLPLPERLRPSDRADFVGQAELVERIFALPAHSLVLHGPPGSGKTTLARLLSRHWRRPFFELSAVSSGVKEIRELLARSVQPLLFVDEIHRFSKTQQDALLPAVENGTCLLIGATTENPGFSVIPALQSRLRIYRLLPLSNQELQAILARGLALYPDLQLETEAVTQLLEWAGGDARKLLVSLELLGSKGQLTVARSDLTALLGEAVRSFDRQGDNHYDTISAFIKSIRGSDPDAALLYLAVMIDGGEDPLFIVRRLIILASEDVGNAVPQALGMAVAASQALECIGMPEGRMILAQLTTYLAACPKSNASYLAIDAALQAVQGRAVRIPAHLQNAPTRLHKAQGQGQGYLYPHDYPDGFVDQTYLPSEFANQQFYFPGSAGQEQRLKERLKALGRKNRRYD